VRIFLIVDCPPTRAGSELGKLIDQTWYSTPMRSNRCIPHVLLLGFDPNRLR
jgi:hypothetical protein